MKRILVLLFILVIFTNCQFSQSAKQDLVTGITFKGSGLSCDDIYLTVGKEKITRNSFIYGETFFLKFSNMTGFVKVGENAFPGMNLFVLNLSGDTVFRTNDLFTDYPNGMNYSPLLLAADLTVADPIRSKYGYTAYVNIWDKKGKGTFNSEFKFKVVENDKINVEANDLTYNEVYLFSGNNNSVITDNMIKAGDKIYMIVEGLSGFKNVNGNVFAGLSLRILDSAKNVLVESNDLLSDYDKSGITPADISARLSANFTLPEKTLTNPLHCELKVWDKKGTAGLKASTELAME